MVLGVLVTSTLQAGTPTEADLIVTQTAEETVAAGDNLIYTVTVSNNGPADATEVVVTDTLPATTTFLLSEGCIEDPAATPECSLGTIPAGAMSSFTLAVAVPTDAVGTLSNVAEATTATTDPNPGNNDATLLTGVTLESDLGVLISDAPDPVVASGTITYTVQVVNNGPSDAEGVQVTDALPEGVVIASSNGCDEDPNGSPTCTLGDLAAGDSATFSVDVQVNPGTVGELANSVTVSSLAMDSNPDNNTAGQTTTAFAEADLDVTLSAAPDTVVAGETLTYTVFIENNGPSNATNVRADMLLPPEATSVETSGCDEDPMGLPTCSLGDLVVGATTFYQVTVTVAPSTLGTITNQVFISNDAGDPDSGNNEADFDATVISEADLMVSKTDDTTTAVPGGEVTYTIEVRNTGPSDATEIQVIDPFPTPLDCAWQCAPEEGATCTSGQIRADLIDTITLPAGTGAVYTAVCGIDPAATGTLANTVRVNYPGIDPDPLDNFASDLDTVLSGRADLRLGKSDGIALTAPGQTVTYTVVVNNDGPSDAPGSRVVDTLPDALETVTWTCSASSGSSCTSSGVDDLDDVVDIAAGGQLTYLISGTVADDASGFLVNSATVSIAEGLTDPNLNNNSETDFDTEITDVQADLRISKTDMETSATPGGEVTYSIVVTNDGPQAVDDARIQDIFPSTLSCIWSCQPSEGASCTPGQIAGDIDHLLDVPAAGSVTYTAVCQIDPGATGSLSNTATVTPPAGVLDPDLIDNSASDLDTVLSGRADLRITKTDGTTLTAPGQPLTYTLQVFNDGPSDAEGARIQDVFSSALRDVTWTCTATGTSSCTAAAGGDIDDTVMLRAGDSLTYLATGTVTDDAAGTLLNTATVTAPEGVDDPNGNNNTAVDLDTQITNVLADLAISKTDNTSQATPGDTIDYEIIVTNEGSNEVLGAYVEDLFPAELACIWTCTGEGGAQCAAGQVAGDIQQTVDLPTAAKATFHAACTIDGGASGTLSNTATVQVPAGAVDPNPLNNSASDLDTVLGGRADLSIEKTDNLTVTSPGEVITYFITVRNDGPSDVDGILVTDTFPGDLEDISWTCIAGGGASCPAGGVDTIDATVNVPSGAGLIFQASATVSAGASGHLENTASLTVPEGVVDPNLNNNTAIDFDTAVSAVRADLSISKTDNTASAVPGDTLDYVIIVGNDGPAEVVGARVGDIFPASLSCLWTCTTEGGAQCTAGQVAGDIDHLVNLPVMSTVRYDITCTIDADAAGTLSNTATITAPPDVFDPNLLDNSASDLDTVLLSPQVDLTLSLSDGVETAVPGASVTYTLEARHEPALFALVETAGQRLLWQVDTASGTVTDLGPVAGSCDRLGFAEDGLPKVTCDGPGSHRARHPVRDTLVGWQGDGGSPRLLHLQDHPDCPRGEACSLQPVPSATPPLTLQLPAEGIDPRLVDLLLVDLRYAPPSAPLAGIRVQDIFPDVLACRWTCQSSLGSSCTAGPVVGDIQDTVNIASGGRLTYTAVCDIASGAIAALASESLVNRAELLVPAGVDDIDGDNNTATDSNTLTPRGDLQVSKTDGRTSVAPGELLSYTVQVHNPGPSDVQNATVVDDLPALPLSGVFWTCTPSLGSVCSAAGVNTLLDTVHIQAGGSLTFLIQGRVNGDADGSLVNSATVTAPDGFTDPILNNNTALDFDTTVTPRADLAVSVSDGVTSAVPGESLSYTVTVANGGPSDVQDGTVRDLFPDALQNISWTCLASPGSSCTAAGAGDLLDSVQIRAAGLLTYAVTGTLDPAARGTLANTATITAPFGTVDPNLGDNSASDLDTLLTPRADVTLSKSDGVTSAVPGGSVTYTLTAGNSGPSDVFNARLDDSFADSLSCLWTCVADGDGVCTPGQAGGDIHDTVDLPVGGSIVYTAVCTIDPAAEGTLSNTATVTLGSDTVELRPGDNTSSDLDTVLTPQADLAIGKSDGVTSAAPGDSLTYTLTVENLGPSAVSGAHVVDSLPASFRDALWTCQATAGASCVAAGAGDLSELVDLAPDSSLVFEVTGTLDTDATGTLSNTATVTAPGGVTDAVSANNAATDGDTVLVASADLRISKTDGVTGAVPGGQVTYDITVINDGPSVLSDALVEDAFDSVLSCRWTCVGESGALCNPGPVLGDIADSVHLPAAARVRYEAVCDIDPAATGTLANTATVSPPDGAVDPNLADNSASDLDTVLSPSADLAVTVSDGLTAATPGSPITYTIAVTNQGPSAVSGAQVTDLFPASLDCSWSCLPSADAQCTAGPVSGDLVDSVQLPVGGNATYTAQCTIDPDAQGTLSNTAGVQPPAGVSDPDASNNSATDGDTVLTLSADLTVALTDGVDTATPGESITYTLMVGNEGPNGVAGARVEDLFSDELTCLWGCVGSQGAQCTPGQVAGDLIDTVQLPVGAVATYTIDCQIDPSAVGDAVTHTLSNTAIVQPPPGVEEADATDNSASDLDTRLIARADVQITKSDDVSSATPGGQLIYRVDVRHGGGPSTIDGAVVRDTPPAALSCSWTCDGRDGAQCSAGPQVGDLLDAPRLPPGSAVTYEGLCGIDPLAVGTLSNTATVELPADAEDPDLDNNSATDDTVLVPQVDLSLELDNGQTTTVPGTEVEYLLTARSAVGAVALTATADGALHLLVLNDAQPDVAVEALPLADCRGLWRGADGLLRAACDAADRGAAADDDVASSNPDAAVWILRRDTSGAVQVQREFDPTVQPPAQLGNAGAAGGSFERIRPHRDGPQRLRLTISGDQLVLQGEPVDADSGATEAQPSQRLLRHWPMPESLRGRGTVTPRGLVLPEVANAQGAQVLSQPPAALQCTWTCQPSGDADCTPGPVDGNINDLVDLGLGAQLTYRLTCQVAADAAEENSTLALQASLVPPVDVVDVDPSNNSANDIDSLTPRADLILAKTDGVTLAVAGESVTYTLAASNPEGPSDVTDAQVSDLFADALSCVWTCSGEAGGRCTPGQEAGDIVDLVDLPVGAQVVYTAVCAIDAAATGFLTNTAQITLPAGADDPVPGNNAASDLDTQLVANADLSISKTDGVTSVAPGGQVDYTLVVRHVSGSSSVQGARVEDYFADDLDCLWTCSPTAGAGCASGQVAGDIVDTVILPIGSQLTYHAVCHVAPDATGILSNTATVTLPAGAVDPDLGNNSASDTDTVLTPTADLVISKSNGSEIVIPGEAVVYDVVARNEGPSDVTGATVGDIFPDDLEACSWTCQGTPGASCTAGPVLGDLNDSVHLSADSEVAYRVSCTVADDATGQVLNSATVSAPDGVTDGNPNNNTAVDLDTVFLEDADLMLSKTDGVTQAAPGGDVTYTLVAANPNGPTDIADARLFDQPDASLSCVWSCTTSGGGACAATPITGTLDTLVTLPVGGEVTYRGVCRIAADARGVLINTASLSLPVGASDPDPSNNTASDLDTVLVPTADLQLSKSDGVTSAVPGSTLEYDIDIDNPGPSDLLAATVRDEFPGNLACTWQCTSASGGATCTSTSSSGDLVDAVQLPAGGGLSYRALCDLPLDLTGTVVNTVIVDSEAGTFSARDDDTVLQPTADLSISKTDGVTSAIPGQAVTYSIVVRNDDGPSDLLGAVVRDDFPGVTSCNWSCLAAGGADCIAGTHGGNLNDTADLPVGSSATYTAVCLIDPAAGGSLINTATVSLPSGTGDPNLANNSATDIDALVRSHDLALSLSGDPASVFPGGDLVYTLSVSNSGPSDAPAVSLTDILPGGVSFVSATVQGFGGGSSGGGGEGMIFRDGFESGGLSAWAGGGGGTAPPPAEPCVVQSGQTLACTLGSLAAAATGTVTLTTRVDAAASAGTVINQATVSSSGDPNSGNNTATAETTILGSDTDVGIQVTDAPDPVTAGDDLFYTLVVTNHGPAVATGVTAVDNLPPQVSLVSATPSVGTCSNDVGVVTCQLGELAVDESAEVALWVVVSADATSALTNPANVAAVQVDPNPVNDVDFETTTVQSPDGLITYSPEDLLGPRLPGAGQWDGLDPLSPDGEPVEIPTLSTWGVMALMLALVLFALSKIRQTALRRSAG